MTTSKSTQPIARKRMVVKLGGSMLEGLSKDFFVNFAKLQKEDTDLIIVHGGGPAIARQLDANNVASAVKGGIRVTSKEAASLIQTTLIGSVNPKLVHQMNHEGIESIGLSGYDGNLLTCSLLDESTYGFVGKITNVRSELLEKLLQAGIVPVISCIGSTTDGEPLNINADTVASEIALALKAESLLLVTDTPGIQIEGNVQAIATASKITKWIESGEIYGGMLPKVKAALNCIDAGIPTVQIVGQQLGGTLIAQEERSYEPSIQ